MNKYGLDSYRSEFNSGYNYKANTRWLTYAADLLSQIDCGKGELFDYVKDWGFINKIPNTKYWGLEQSYCTFIRGQKEVESLIIPGIQQICLQTKGLLEIFEKLGLVLNSVQLGENNG